MPQDDLTPELGLFTVSRDQLLYDAMNMVVDKMLRKWGAKREAQELAEWVRLRIQPFR